MIRKFLVAIVSIFSLIAAPAAHAGLASEHAAIMAGANNHASAGYGNRNPDRGYYRIPDPNEYTNRYANRPDLDVSYSESRRVIVACPGQVVDYKGPTLFTAERFHCAPAPQSNRKASCDPMPDGRVLCDGVTFKGVVYGDKVASPLEHISGIEVPGYRAVAADTVEVHTTTTTNGCPESLPVLLGGKCYATH